MDLSLAVGVGQPEFVAFERDPAAQSGHHLQGLGFELQGQGCRQGRAVDGCRPHRAVPMPAGPGVQKIGIDRFESLFTALGTGQGRATRRPDLKDTHGSQPPDQRGHHHLREGHGSSPCSPATRG